MKLKVEHFHVYDLVTVFFNYASGILRTRYWEPVPYIGSLDFVESGMYRTVIKFQKNESGNCNIWNTFYIKDVYLNKFYIKIVNMSCDLRCLIIC